jgi:hypothetical protein
MKEENETSMSCSFHHIYKFVNLLFDLVFSSLSNNAKKNHSDLEKKNDRNLCP